MASQWTKSVMGMGVLASLAASALAQQAPEGFALLAAHDAGTLAGEPWIRPAAGQALALDEQALRDVLRTAPMEFSLEYRAKSAVLALPAPDGSVKLFRVFESPILDAALQAQFPDIRTYAGQGETNPAETLRLDLSPSGLRVQVLGPDGAWYIDPVTKGDNTHYTSYFKLDLGERLPFRCLMMGVGPQDEDDGFATHDGSPAFLGSQLRTFRLAVTTTGEYSAFHGGTTASVLAAVTTAVNRVTGVYERDLAVRLQLVAGTTQTLFLNASTDPYTAPSPSGTTMNAAQQQFNTLIGNANYDVGHLFHRAANSGVAGAIGNVCVAGSADGSTGKGRGVSQTEPPVNDPFSIDYVAHELGHQFGGRHSFNNCGGGPGDDPSIAHEPGSGSTIMGYAGICGSNDVQPNSDPMFASINIDQMASYVATRTCAIVTNTGNSEPVVNAGPDYVIPISTPYELSPQSVLDGDNDALTFSWEQRNGGSAVALPLTDNGSNPLARVFAPSQSPRRMVPRLANVLSGTFLPSEVLPTTNRTMNWRLVARDNRAGGGGVDFDDITVRSVTTAGPFRVTAPSAPVSAFGGSPLLVTWNVANTTASPVSAANVRIRFSSDGGLTWPTVLEASTPNDGSHTVTLPPVPTTQGLIRVEGENNIFFNLNRGGFITITQPPPGILLTQAGPIALSDTTGNGNANNRIDPGESALSISVPLANVGADGATGIVGTLESLTSTASIVGDATRSYPSLASLAAAQTSAQPFVLSVSPAHPCGQPIALRLLVSTNQGTQGPFTFSMPVGTPGGSVQTTIRFTGPSVAIPNNSSVGVNIPLVVPPLGGPITDLNVRIDGTSCNTNVAATSNGINHTALGDLVISLIGPSGTEVVLRNRRGGSGNNLCSSTFDDAGTLTMASIASTGAPWSNSYIPESPLAALQVGDGSGTWTLRVVDQAANNSGNVAAFSLLFTNQLTATCQAPVSACDGIDYNNDGLFPDDADLVDFLSILAGGACSTDPAPGCNDVDFNNDGLFPDDADLLAFLRVLAGGTCD
jgi:subtilisin-like proprotein convertase family protein